MARGFEGGIGGIHTAVAHFGGNVVGDAVAQQGCVGSQRVVHMHGHRQLGIVDHDGLTRVARLGEGLRHHGHHRVTDKTNLVHRQGGAWRTGSGRAIRSGKARHCW